MNIKFDTQDPFGPIIREMIARAYPTQQIQDKSLLLDLIVGEVFGTKQVRFGPKPSIESQYMIRAAVKAMIEANVPIRFIAPWGRFLLLSHGRELLGPVYDCSRVQGIHTLIWNSSTK